MKVHDFEGQVGNPSHITRRVHGTLPVSVIANLHGAAGERPGEHRNKQGAQWDSFVSDVKERGIQEPIFITHDYGQQPKISEGNHRRDAAVEAGHADAPVEVSYFGHAERHDKLFNDRRQPGLTSL